MLTKDDYMPTPKAFKFFRTSDAYFKDNLDKMVHHNTVWLSPAKDFNDPLEMSSFVRRADIHKNSIRLMEDFRRMVENPQYLNNRVEKLEAFLPSDITMDQVQQFLDALRARPEFHKNPHKVFSDIAEQSGTNLVEILSNSIVATTNKFSDGFYLLCLTDNIYNSAMWAYYAENQTGIAVEFHRSSPPAIYARQVTYTDKVLSPISSGLDYLATKNIYWRHESERRYMITKGIENREGQFVDEGNYFCFDNASLEKCGGSLVKAIYIGLKTPAAVVENIVSILESAAHFIQIYEAGINLEHYSLEFLPLLKEPTV